MSMRSKFVAALAAATVAVAGLAGAGTAFAADPSTTTITVKDTTGTFAAYRLMDETESNGADGTTHVAYSVNAKYRDALRSAIGDANASDATIIDTVGGYDEAAARTFAASAKRAIADAGLTADATSAPDTDAQTSVFANVPQGYYLIAQTGEIPAGEAKSALILDTKGGGDLEIEAKANVPSVYKKVKETDDSTGETSDWQDAADHDIADAVPFQLTGALPDDFDAYQTYRYVFHDRQSAGLTFNADSVKVYAVVGGQRTEVAAGSYGVHVPGTDRGDTFSVEFADLKAVTGVDGQPLALSSDSLIVVEYTSTLNEDAVIGEAGNPNAVRLEYANDYEQSGAGDVPTGYTPWDKVIVFTYRVVANKTDASNKPLAGAGFTLSKWNHAANQWSEVRAIAAGAGTTFEFSGLDAGMYRLSETTVPDGYNKADDIEFTIRAAYTTDADDPTLSALSVVDAQGQLINEFTVERAAGTATTTIVNRSGSLLPGTGGMGTTMLYAAGGALVVAAGAWFALRRRDRR